mmetsp:Transcript_5263/g.14117  ORF Transcript_5263/g.14117 Transcript_5263/m.14117 type:complete len:243 (-) Transcript_5263:359-1087(-)
MADYAGPAKVLVAAKDAYELMCRTWHKLRGRGSSRGKSRSISGGCGRAADLRARKTHDVRKAQAAWHAYERGLFGTLAERGALAQRARQLTVEELPVGALAAERVECVRNEHTRWHQWHGLAGQSAKLLAHFDSGETHAQRDTAPARRAQQLCERRENQLQLFLARHHAPRLRAASRRRTLCRFCEDWRGGSLGLRETRTVFLRRLKLARLLRVLPRPFKLQSLQPVCKARHEHDHPPRSVP